MLSAAHSDSATLPCLDVVRDFLLRRYHPNIARSRRSRGFKQIVQEGQPRFLPLLKPQEEISRDSTLFPAALALPRRLHDGDGEFDPEPES